MNLLKVALLLGVALFLAGCGGKDEDQVSAPPPPAAPPVDMNAPAPVAPATPPLAPPPAPAAPGAAAATSPAAPETGDFVTMGEDGKPIPSLDFVNLAIDGYNRTRSAQTEGEFWPPLTSVEQLVQYRVISRLPSAPAGQKFVIHPETGKAALAPK